MHFGGKFPGKVDLEESVPVWEQAAFEERWRQAGVRVEWLRSPAGRVDDALADAESVAHVMRPDQR